MSIFNENMSYYEAQKTLFSSVDGKSKEEIEEIKKEYSAVLPKIFSRETDVKNGWMTECPI